MKRQKKVLFTSHTANFVKFNRPFMRDLRENGQIVHYASAGEEEILDADKDFVVPFARSPLKLSNLKAYRELKKLLEREKYDLVHCHTPVGGVVTRLAVKHAKLQKKPKVIYTGHGFHFYRGAPLINWLIYYPIEKWLAKSTDVVVTINNEDYALARRKLQTEKVEIIPGVGVDLGRFRPANAHEKEELRRKNNLEKDDFVLIYAAEINKNKSQELIIDEITALKEIIPRIKVLFVGKGPEQRRLEEKVGRLGLRDTVRFLGYRKDMAELYRMADVAVSASRREGLGLNLIEGMASGLPIVARDNRGHREIVVSDEEGVLFRDGDGFREAILEMKQNPRLREKISKHNVEAAKKFGLEKARAKMAEIYKEALGEL